MYATFPSDRHFYQGDILKDCKFFLPPLGENQNQTPRAYEGNAIILTQTCDIVDDENVLLGFIEPVEDFKRHVLDSGKDELTAESFLGKLKSKKPFHKEAGLFQWFYLPAQGELIESIAWLNRVALVNKSELNIDNRIAYLSFRGRQWLQYYLIRLFGRPFYWE